MSQDTIIVVDALLSNDTSEINNVVMALAYSDSHTFAVVLSEIEMHYNGLLPMLEALLERY